MAEPDPKRWLILAVVLMAVVVVVIDNTVLVLALPTIVRDLDTTLHAAQWVVTGYALTFAMLLVIGGRLVDLYGPRRIFAVGAGLFGVGSLIASLASTLPQLIAGEAIVEGIGASLMMPATLVIISTTFSGRERASAFGTWGAVAGGASAFGPMLGGYLTTYHSWRWAFGLNVIVAVMAVLGATILMRRHTTPARREGLDVIGAVVLASGIFGLVFAISQAPTFGWFKALGVGTRMPGGHRVSVVPLVLVVSALALTSFVMLERRKEREDGSPLFEFGQLRHRTFRYGLITALVLAGGQFGVLLALPVFLQDGKHLSAMANGVWMMPMGISLLVAAQFSGRLTRIIGTTTLVRVGVVMDALGLVVVGLAVGRGMTFVTLLPGLVMFGAGMGFASAQLTNVVLVDIPPEKAGVASGANTTVRQLGMALGAAIIGSVLAAQTRSRAVAAIGASDLPPNVRSRAIGSVRGGAFAMDRAPRELVQALESAVAASARPAILLGASIVVVGAGLSFLIPSVDRRRGDEEELGLDLYDVVPLEANRHPSGPKRPWRRWLTPPAGHEGEAVPDTLG